MDEAGGIAREAREFWQAREKKRQEDLKELDQGAVRLLIIRQCFGKNPKDEYAPPVKIVVNGIEFGEIGKDKDEATIWYSAKQRVKELEKITVELIPFGKARAGFKKGESERQAYNPAYWRTERELHDRDYHCPPEDEKMRESVKPHRVFVDVPVKRKWRFGGDVHAARDFLKSEGAMEKPAGRGEMLSADEGLHRI